MWGHSFKSGYWLEHVVDFFEVLEPTFCKMTTSKDSYMENIGNMGNTKKCAYV